MAPHKLPSDMYPALPQETFAQREPPTPHPHTFLMGDDGETLRAGLHVEFGLSCMTPFRTFSMSRKNRSLDYRSEPSRNLEWKQISKFYHEDLLAVKHTRDVDPKVQACSPSLQLSCSIK